MFYLYDLQTHEHYDFNTQRQLQLLKNKQSILHIRIHQQLWILHRVSDFK